MSGHCHSCGWPRLLDAVTFWCRECADTWARKHLNLNEGSGSGS